MKPTIVVVQGRSPTPPAGTALSTPTADVILEAAARQPPDQNAAVPSRKDDT